MKIAPLIQRGVNNTEAAVIAGNLAATFERGYKPLAEVKEDRGQISIAGSGPSLAWTYKDLVGETIACNSAHDFLISRGVIPTFAMLWDANPIMVKAFTPHAGVKYLVASRCHPCVFEKLKGFDVTVWHALGDEELLALVPAGEPLIAGGSASAIRAVYVAAALGYRRDVHLFGVDSSYSQGKSHVSDSLTRQGSLEIRVCGAWFTVAPWMAFQGEEFKLFVPILKELGIRLVVHGTGLLPYLATFLGVEAPDLKVGFWERLRREIHAMQLMFLEVKNSPQLLGGSNAGV